MRGKFRVFRFSRKVESRGFGPPKSGVRGTSVFLDANRAPLALPPVFFGSYKRSTLELFFEIYRIFRKFYDFFEKFAIFLDF